MMNPWLLPIVLVPSVQEPAIPQIQPFEPEGAYILESVVDHYDVGVELRKQSRDYVDRHSPSCFQADTPEERRWLESMKIGPYRDETRIPVGWRVMKDASRFGRTEWIRGSLASGHQHSVVFHHDPPQEQTVFHRILTPEGEVFDWQETAGKKRAVRRYSYEGGLNLFGNGFWSLRRFFHRALHVFSKAEHVDPSGFSVSLDLRRVANCMEIDYFPLEVYDVAGRVVLSWSGQSLPRALTLEWRDRNDALLLRERAVWRSEERMPDEYRKEALLVGTSTLMAETRISILPWREAPPIGEWSPEAGDMVLDDRFDFTVLYRVKEGGGMPTEEQVAQRAWEGKLARYARSVDEGGDPTRTKERETPEGLEVPWDTVSLGRYALGTWRPVEFEITNRGKEEIGIGRIETSCGCVEASASRTRLGPGQTSRLSAFQQAAALGPSVSPIRVLVSGPGDEERTLELQIRYEGLPVPQLDLPVYELGTLAVGEEHTLEFRALWSLEPEHELVCELRHGGAAVAFDHGIELMKDAEAGHYVGKLSFVVPERYGVSSVDLVARGKDPAGEPREGSAPVFWECTPPVEGWPRCRLLLHGSEPAVLRLPETEVLGAAGGEGLLEVRHENGPDGSATVTFRAKDARIARELVRLTTSRGTVGVLVLVSGP